jgi:hypothetical protein
MLNQRNQTNFTRIDIEQGSSIAREARPATPNQGQTMSLMSRTWFVRCLTTNILDAPATVFLHVWKHRANQSSVNY